MARRMRPLDPTAGPVQRFACELRALRAAHGDLPFWKMARQCAVSKSALAAAAAGVELPSERVTREFVQACGGDWQWWRQRWLRAGHELDTAAEADHNGASDAALVVSARGAVLPRAGLPTRRAGPARDHTAHALPTGPEPRRSLMWLVRLLAGVILGTAAVAGALVLLGWHLVHDPKAARSAAMVEDATDPKTAGCLTDRTNLETVPVVLRQPARVHGRLLKAGTRVGSVELVFSPHCAGAWAHFDPTPGLNPEPRETTVATVTIEADRPADSTMAQFRLGHVDSTYSDMLLTGVGCVTATARVAMSGQNSVATGHTRCLPRL